MNFTRACDVSGGLLGLGRNIIMKLCIMMWDESDKIKNILGMCGESFQWKNHVCFRESRPIKYPIILVPRSAPEGLTYSFSKVTFKGNERRYSMYVGQGLASSLHKVFIFDVGVAGYFGVGLASKALFPFLHSSFLFSRNGTCGIFHQGIFTGVTRVLESHCWDGSTMNFPVSLSLELNQVTDTLHFFLGGQQIPHCVTNVPRNVCFAIGNTGARGGVVEMYSLLSMPRSTINSNIICKKYPWIY